MRCMSLSVSCCNLCTAVARPGFVPSHTVFLEAKKGFLEAKKSTEIPVESLFKNSFHIFFNGIQRLHVRLSLVTFPGIGAFA